MKVDEFVKRAQAALLNMREDDTFVIGIGAAKSDRPMAMGVFGLRPYDLMVIAQGLLEQASSLYNGGIEGGEFSSLEKQCLAQISQKTSADIGFAINRYFSNEG